MASAEKKPPLSPATPAQAVLPAAERVAELLGAVCRGDRDAQAAARDELVSVHLYIARRLVASLGLSSEEAEEAFQEACLGLTVGVAQYVERSMDPLPLAGYLERVAGLYLDAALARSEEQSRADRALAADVQTLERKMLALSAEFGREPSPLELDAALGWTTSYRELVEQLLVQARLQHDEQLLPFLDPDLDRDEEG